VCDGLDNNCNGSADEGNPGGNQSCTTGKPGVCSPGTTACTGGAIKCNQNVQASAEVCDGIDNDCDGAVDNGNPGGGVACSTGLQGVCAAGTTACTAGTIKCNQNVSASAEVCDGKDNDCNGKVDDSVTISDGIPNNCTQAVNKTVTVPPGGSIPVQGYIDTAGDDWFEVAFSSVGAAGTYYHPSIVLGANGGQFKINVFTGCGSTSQCSQPLDSWDMTYPANPNNCQAIPGECVDLSPRITTWIVQVTRIAGAPFDCTQYTVTVSNQ
jgi:hypothetical protein